MAEKDSRLSGIVPARVPVRKVDNPRLVVRRMRCKEEDFAELEARGYSLGQTLGEGTYGKVKVATSKRHDGIRVAVKIINKKKAPEGFKNKFLPREIDILSEIRHPNIIKLHDAFTVGKKVYFIMELAGHGDLLEYVKLRGKLTEHRSRMFFRDIADAIGYCHDLGIVHRDLKCENLLLDARNTIKLTDFGFARRMGPGDVSHTYCGSAAYAAPEILRGTEYHGMKNDVWSLGVILYIMVTGMMPFDDSDIPKLVRQQQKKLTFPKSAASLSYSSRQLIKMLLEYNATARASVKDIKNAEWLTIPALQSVQPKEPADEADQCPSLISQILGNTKAESMKRKQFD